MFRALSLLLCLLLPAALVKAASPATVTVAAASDLKFALDEIAAEYERAGGERVRVVYGSSGNLARQIAQGAPFDVFLSADEQFVEDLGRRGLTVDGGALYAIGRIVLFAPGDGVFQPDASMADLRRALLAGEIRRFAIANPEHAPYGRAAREALQRAGLWDLVADRVVMGENVSQAAQFASSGNAQGGIFALSLATAPAFEGRGRWVLLPQELHAPLRQRLVVLRRAPAHARRFADHLQQPAARRILARYGFMLPGDR